MHFAVQGAYQSVRDSVRRGKAQAVRRWRRRGDPKKQCLFLTKGLKNSRANNTEISTLRSKTTGSFNQDMLLDEHGGVISIYVSKARIVGPGVSALGMCQCVLRVFLGIFSFRSKRLFPWISCTSKTRHTGHTKHPPSSDSAPVCVPPLWNGCKKYF